MESTNRIVMNAVAAQEGVARNDKDGYIPLIQAFNKLTNGYFEVERALDRFPDAKATVERPLKDVYAAIGKAHDALKKWNA